MKEKTRKYLEELGRDLKVAKINVKAARKRLKIARDDHDQIIEDMRMVILAQSQNGHSGMAPPKGSIREEE